MDFRLAVMGQSVTGRVDVRESAVDLSNDLPWILARFADKVRGDVQREGTTLLEKKERVGLRRGSVLIAMTQATPSPPRRSKVAGVIAVSPPLEPRRPI